VPGTQDSLQVLLTAAIERKAKKKKARKGFSFAAQEVAAPKIANLRRMVTAQVLILGRSKEGG